MAGIGEASAIIGLVQLGFSLATALNTYASEVKEARDDILGLSSDIESTFAQLRDLGKLIELNGMTNVWSEDGVKIAQKCVTDCQNSIAKLRELLKKSTASVTSDAVERDEIDVSKFERALWPIHKRKLEVQKQELRSIKQDILIAYASYNAKAGATELDRKRARNDLPGLQRTKVFVRMQVQAARDRSRSQRPGRQRDRHRQRQQRSQFYNHDLNGSYERERGGIPGGDSSSELDDEVVYETRDDLEADFEVWLRDRESEKKKVEEERKKIQDDAVKAWQKQRLDKAKAEREQVQSDRITLHRGLEKEGMAERQIIKLVDQIHPLKSVSDHFQALILAAPREGRPESSTTDESKSTKRRSIWSRM